MRLTLPQIFMLNHGATVNHARGEERAAWLKNRKEHRDKHDPIVEGTGGKRLSQCNSAEIAAQFRGM
jgi:hypothetical protein